MVDKARRTLFGDDYDYLSRMAAIGEKLKVGVFHLVYEVDVRIRVVETTEGRRRGDHRQGRTRSGGPVPRRGWEALAEAEKKTARCDRTWLM